MTKLREEKVQRALFSAREAAAYMNVGKTLFWKLRYDPKAGLPMVRLGRRLMFPRIGLDRWIDNRTVFGAMPAERRKEAA